MCIHLLFIVVLFLGGLAGTRTVVKGQAGLASALSALSEDALQLDALVVQKATVQSRLGAFGKPETEAQQTIGNTFLMSLTWNGSMFVGVGSAGQQGSLFSSLNGKTWTHGRPQISSPLRSVARNGQLFVTVGLRGETRTSPDGQVWKKQTSGTTQDLLRVIWDGTHFDTDMPYAFTRAIAAYMF